MHTLAFFFQTKITLKYFTRPVLGFNKISFSCNSLKFSYLPFSDPQKDGLLLFCAILSNFLSIKEVITSRSNDLSEISAYLVVNKFNNPVTLSLSCKTHRYTL